LVPLKSIRTTIAKPQGSDPLEPPGAPGLPPKLPPRNPDPNEPEAGFRVVQAGSVYYYGDEVHVNGGGEMLIRGYHVFADRGRGNRSTEVWELEGNVRVIGSETVISGDRIIVDFKSETYRAFSAESQLSPRFLGTDQLLDQAYVDGRESFGSRYEVQSRDGAFTTCNYDHPHYELAGEDTVVRAGRRVILRRTRIRLFDRTLFTLPYLVIPLQQQNYKYTPDVGQSRDEGYYVKNRYGIPLRSGQVLDTRLDYMSKLGTGTGAGIAYGGGTSNGELTAYQITGQANTLNIANRHEQQFRWGSLSLSNDLQRNNYLSAPGTSLLQNRATLNLPWQGGSSRINYNRSNNESSGFSSSNQTITLSDNRRWRSGLNTRLDVNHVSTGSRGFGTSNSREQIDLLFHGDRELRRATIGLDYQRSIPIGDVANFFSGSDRTPVVTLASDSRRLFGQSADRFLPFTTELSLGEYQNTSTDGRVTRSAFDFNFRKSDGSSGRLRTEWNGQFKQGLYSDDTAQYILRFGSGITYRTSRDTSINLRYNYLRPYGFTPLSIDRSGRTNIVTLDASARTFRTLKLGVQTGYDIFRLDEGQVPWQQVGVRSEWEPSKWFLLRGLSNYDTFQQQWSSVRLDLTYRPGATLFTIGARYDGIRQVWGGVNVVLQNLKVGRTRFSTILQYNGYTRQFDSRQYNLIYDLHCAEAVVNVIENNVGFRAGREIQFLLRLKAFPFSTQFGNGRRGQPLGIGTGRDF
jgi:LPS-assembly protein